MIKNMVLDYVGHQYSEYGAYAKRDLLHFAEMLRDAQLLTISEYTTVHDVIIEIARDLMALYH